MCIILICSSSGPPAVHRALRVAADPDPLQPRQHRAEGYHQTDLAQCQQEEPQLPGIA